MTKFGKSALCVGGMLPLFAVMMMGGCHKSAQTEQATVVGGVKHNSADYAGQLQQLTAASTLSVMMWPNYADVQPQVQKFYALRNNEIAWTRDGVPTQAATEMMQLFADAAKKGLRPEDYDAQKWPARVQRLAAGKNDNGDAAKLVVAQFDAAMTIDAMRYVSALHTGRVNPESLNFDIDVPGKRAAFDFAGFLNSQVVDSGDVAAAVTTVEPVNPMYVATEKALPQYLLLAQQQDAAPKVLLPDVPATAAVKVGGTYAALPQLLARLQVEGDAPMSVAASTSYDEAMSDSVKHYQGRHGLTPDGTLTTKTIASLNVPLDVRVQQMDDTLERWRWLPDEYVQPRVFVNLPEFYVRTYEADHSLAFKMKVVDGEAQGNHDTPMFVREMKYVVFRPFWNVPTSIIKKELVPHMMKSGATYLADKGYEVVTNTGDVKTDYTTEDIAHLKYVVRQKPGHSNSLGLVKFLFPNEYSVYMHSTPELPLFNLTRRDRSHGCVRLEHADQMAQWVLQGQGDWDADKIAAAMNGTNDNKTVNLKTPLPVVITYMTAMADEDGTMHFFDDIYGYDKKLDAALAKGMPYEQETVKINPTQKPGETE